MIFPASIAKMARGAAGVYRCKSPEAILEAAWWWWYEAPDVMWSFFCSVECHGCWMCFVFWIFTPKIDECLGTWSNLTSMFFQFTCSFTPTFSEENFTLENSHSSHRVEEWLGTSGNYFVDLIKACKDKLLEAGENSRSEVFRTEILLHNWEKQV